jgi:predicted nucleic acid-binding protein
VLVDAKRAGLVPLVGPLIEQLQATGLFLSDRVIAHMLDLAEE